jgi:hypothetical protein
MNMITDLNELEKTSANRVMSMGIIVLLKPISKLPYRHQL